ncbi:MAG: hypothetical protein OXU61_02780 [Gammaproteobacteria bacterium]|nr:hypothetical protein [Gammaproteobacteria bacterium]
MPPLAVAGFVAPAERSADFPARASKNTPIEADSLLPCANDPYPNRGCRPVPRTSPARQTAPAPGTARRCSTA